MMNVNCRQAFRLMHRYFDNELSEALRDAVGKHFNSCPRCGAELQRLIALRRAVQSLPEAPSARDLWPEIRAEACPPARASVWEEAEPLFRRLIPLAAALLFVAMCAFLRIRKHTAEAVPLDRQLAAAVFPSEEEAILLDGPISPEMVLKATIYRDVGVK